MGLEKAERAQWDLQICESVRYGNLTDRGGLRRLKLNIV